MMKRVFAVAAIVVAAMAVAKDGRLLRNMQITGSCRAVTTAADGSQVQACRPGKLEGAPRLTAQGCTAVGKTGLVQYWRCPAQLDTSQIGR